MIIGTKPTAGDASETLCRPVGKADEPAGPFALPAVYVALMFDEPTPADGAKERITA